MTGNRRVLLKVYLPGWLKEAVRELATASGLDASTLARRVLEAYVRGDCICVQQPAAGAASNRAKKDNPRQATPK